MISYIYLFIFFKICSIKDLRYLEMFYVMNWVVLISSSYFAFDQLNEQLQVVIKCKLNFNARMILN